MSQPIDIIQISVLPQEVVKAFSDIQFELSVERAVRLHEQAAVAEKDVFITELKELIETLLGHVQEYRRTKFGPKSEKLDPAQMELALEDLETAIAETQARIAASTLNATKLPLHARNKSPCVACEPATC
ncbi:transposase C of IS166 homeodomain protein [Brucella thiophenivorans]|uniref:Transposase C of IS166 homeodomain protein n=1 Tax=Brucella thiophenivorans TaxID=571255 RepID=A0A256FK73_9HYPH|nr:transposase C of IS166 homeodomain protein [Brucella thiophenivorans]